MSSQEQRLEALGQSVLLQQGNSSPVNSASAARAYLASAEVQQLRIADITLLLSDFRNRAQELCPSTAQQEDAAALSAAMFSPMGAIGDMLSSKDLFVKGQDDAVDRFVHADAGSLHLGDVAQLQTVYSRIIEVATVPLVQHL